MGRPRSLPALPRPLRHRALRGAHRGRNPSRERAGDLRVRRQPAADVGHGDVHPGNGNLRRLARPGLAHRGRNRARPSHEEESRGRLQQHVGRRARRRFHLGGGALGEPPRPVESHLPRRREPSAGGRPLGERPGLRAPRRQVGRLRLARATRERQRSSRGGPRLRCRSGHAQPQPRAILVETRLGRGVPFLEAREKNHFMQVAADEWRQAIALLDAAHGADPGAQR